MNNMSKPPIGTSLIPSTKSKVQTIFKIILSTT